MLRPILQAGEGNDREGEGGFTLLELLCVITIVAILAGMAVPMLPRETSRARLESYAVATAAVLKGDRNAAIRRRADIVTQVDAGSRSVRSGATGRMVQYPNDVVVDTLLSARCRHLPPGAAIAFLGSGMSCGGVIALTRPGITYQVRVDWLTGDVEIVSVSRG